MGKSAASDASAVQLKAASGPIRREKNTPTTTVPQIAKTTFSFFPRSKNRGSFALRSAAAIQGNRGLRVPSEYQGYQESSIL
jgi:hypothetical protein